MATRPRLAVLALAASASLGLITACGTATEAGNGSTGSPAPVASGEPAPGTAPSSPAAASTAGAPTPAPSASSLPASSPASPSTSSSTSARTAAPSNPLAPATHPAPALPGDATAYADDLVRAWGAGRRADASRYATSGAVRALFSHADPGGKHWKRVGAQGAAGTIYVSYRDEASGDRVTLAVGNAAVAEHQRHAVREARFG